ncbi:hypothetical protein BEWA_023520 [Theileria equi strain WA]|uniref:CNNM transmembrane domain-containing protein n=1 Tax=Theileria equi strain WA TaxID=1537102 RepID=L0AW90_THEEQ|nr:hypothetical protein BEWA_023520 [Theileria equi strain WA]AFZ79503.1 hypothetical protein BEWA_023520 [Theileria equi strain WA]|eukprot:XP_004829169.1 hypothetical protein BEWA_023520 [Theileria equi strain WA]
MQQWVNILATVVCSVLSALFSGLTIGFTSLDLFQLRLLSQADPQSSKDVINKRRAKRILPLRKDSNHLLVTLITCNSMVNAALVLFVGDIFDFTWGFVVSSIIITVFGEITPQTVFFKHQLLLCSTFSYFTRVLKILLFPITKPLSMALTMIVGGQSELVYNRQQWTALVDLQQEFGCEISDDEAKMLKGILKLSTISVESIMTPISEVFGVDADAVITGTSVANISRYGFSKIPILDKKRSQCIIGFLHVKDLLMIDAGSSYKVANLVEAIGKPTYAVDSDSGILTVLSHFKKDNTHIVAVRKVVDAQGDPEYSHVGIVTMDDVVNLILKDSESLDKRDSFSIARQRSGLSRLLDDKKDPRSFTINSILDVYPVGDPESILKLLELDDSQENINAVSRHKVYLIKPQVVLPHHKLTVILKGSVEEISVSDTAPELRTIDAPTVINKFSRSKNSRHKVYVTVTECEIVQIDSDEVCNRIDNRNEDETEIVIS